MRLSIGRRYRITEPTGGENKGSSGLDHVDCLLKLEAVADADIYIRGVEFTMFGPCPLPVY